MEHRNPDGTLLASFTYELEPAGNRVAMTENNGRREDYTYDKLPRLLEERATDPVRGNHSFAYSYDPTSNRLSQSDQNGVTTHYQYDAHDRLLSAGTTSFTYDANGNALTKNENNQTTIYAYNTQNQLIGAQTSAAQLTEHPHLPVIVIEDSLASNGPHIRELQARNLRFILGAKEDDHCYLFQTAFEREQAGEGLNGMIWN